MSSDADLSTGDLADPGGRDRPEAPGADRQMPDRQAGAEASPADETRPRTRETGAERAPDQGAEAWDDGTVPGQQGAGGQMQDQAAATGQAREQTAGTAPARSGAGASAGGGEGADVALLDPAEGQRFRQRWDDVQARFVDDPREAVQTADGLVAELMQSLAGSFNEHKGRLESAWQSGDNPDTEELRQALQRYRSFFDRLLST